MAVGIIALLMMVPSIVVPNVNAETPSVTYTNQMPIPDSVVPTYNLMKHELAQNPGWFGTMSWDSHGAKIDYVGPADTNPFRVKATIFTEMSPSAPINIGVAPTSDRGGATSEYKEVQNFTAQASNVSTVDEYQILNALNSNSSDWIQDGLVYDIAGIYHQANVWKQIIDFWTKSPCAHDNTGFPTGGTITVTAGDSIQSYIYADQTHAGQYDIGISDLTQSTGRLSSISVSGDTGSVINLNQITCGGGAYTSGPQMEEHDTSNSSKIYSFASMSYPQGYYDTTTSAKTTSVSSWHGANGCGATVTTANNPAKATFSSPSAC